MKKNKKKVLKNTKKAAEEKKYLRPSWDEYFMNIAELAGSRGSCDRGRSGCIVVRDKRILCTGYVGSPMGLSHCDDIGHEMHTVVSENGATEGASDSGVVEGVSDNGTTEGVSDNGTIQAVSDNGTTQGVSDNVTAQGTDGNAEPQGVESNAPFDFTLVLKLKGQE